MALVTIFPPETVAVYQGSQGNPDVVMPVTNAVPTLPLNPPLVAAASQAPAVNPQIGPGQTAPANTVSGESYVPAPAGQSFP
jgi:hypothetical protein